MSGKSSWPDQVWRWFRAEHDPPDLLPGRPLAGHGGPDHNKGVPVRPVRAIACSGGGIRAAAFTMGGLQGLHVKPDGEEERWIDKVALITAVSGGSYMAGSYVMLNRSVRESRGRSHDEIAYALRGGVAGGCPVAGPHAVPGRGSEGCSNGHPERALRLGDEPHPDSCGAVRRGRARRWPVESLGCSHPGGQRRRLAPRRVNTVDLCVRSGCRQGCCCSASSASSMSTGFQQPSQRFPSYVGTEVARPSVRRPGSPRWCACPARLAEPARRHHRGWPGSRSAGR